MVTIHIVAGPHCALKTSFFRGAFKGSLCLSAEDFYDQLAEDSELLLDNFLIRNFEDIWTNLVVEAITTAPPNLDIVVDGVTLDDEPLGYNFSTPEGVYRFITILQDAAAKGFINREIKFVIHYLPLPLKMRQIFNHRRRRPYTTEQLKTFMYWDSQLDKLDATRELYTIDDIFNGLKIKET